MNKRFTTALLIFVLLFNSVIGVSAKVYYTMSSNSILNEDGISQSSSVVSNPIGGNITFDFFEDWPEGVTPAEGMFSGSIFDGNSLWLVPFNCPVIVKVSGDGTMTSISMPDGYTPVSDAFFGGAFDGQNIYLAPFNAAGIIQINTLTDVVSFIDTWPEGFDKSEVRFKGAMFDGEKIWFIPSTGNKVVSLDGSGTMTVYDDLPEGFTPMENAFSGGVLTGDSIYFVPDKADGVLVLSLSNGSMTFLADLPEIPNSQGFSGGIFDSEYVYLIPQNKTGIVKINNATKNMEYLPFPESVPGTTAFSGGAFDGRFIWLATTMGNSVVKYDIYNETYTNYSLPEGVSGISYISGAFDGTHVWMAPLNSESLMRISGDNTPPTAMNIFLSTNPGVSVSGEMTASDPDEEDVLTFSIVTSPSMGTVDLDSDTGAFTYAPTGTDTGIDTFTYKANDGKDDSNIATVTITINEDDEGETPIPTHGLYIDLWNHWAEEPANALTEMEVFLGENVDGYYYFYPNYLLTRIGYMILANSTFGFEGSMTDANLPFADLEDAEKWVIMNASAAYHGNMVHGFPVGDTVELRPFENLTRIEAMTIIYNAIKPEGAEDEPLDFDDSETFPEWSIPIMKSLKNIGLLEGYDDNTVRPFATVSRAEAVKMLYQAVLYMEGSGQVRLRLK